MNRRGSSEPFATAMKEPMPKAATSFGPKISTLIPGNFPNSLAAPASKVGVAWLEGRLAHSLANASPLTSATPSSKAGLATAAWGTASVTFSTPAGGDLDLVELYT